MGESAMVMGVMESVPAAEPAGEWIEQTDYKPYFQYGIKQSAETIAARQKRLDFYAGPGLDDRTTRELELEDEGVRVSGVIPARERARRRITAQLATMRGEGAMADGPRQEPSAMEDLESRISLLESEVGRTAIWKFILDFVEGDKDKERAVQRLRASVLGGTHGTQREQHDTLDNRLEALETDLSDVRLFLASQVPDLRTLQSVWVRAVENGEYLADKIIEVQQLAEGENCGDEAALRATATATRAGCATMSPRARLGSRRCTAAAAGEGCSHVTMQPRIWMQFIVRGAPLYGTAHSTSATASMSLATPGLECVSRDRGRNTGAGARCSLVVEQVKGEPDGVRGEGSAAVSRHVAASLDNKAPLQHLLCKPRRRDVGGQTESHEG